MSHDIKSAERPKPDHLLAAIADYVLGHTIQSELAYETAAYGLMDTLACGFQALKYPACTKLLGPVDAFVNERTLRRVLCVLRSLS